MLTVTEVNGVKPSDKIQFITDSGGLYLEVRPNGAKYWRVKYRFSGKENRLSLGVYPKVTLAQARKKRNELKDQLATGTDPSQSRKLAKLTKHQAATTTFEALALEWYGTKKSGWSDSHALTTIERLNRDVLPWLGQRPLGELTPPEILAVLKRIESRGTVETARRCRGYVSQIFDYCIATGRAVNNPAKALGAAIKRTVGGHHPAIVEPGRFGQMLRDIQTYAGNPITRAALQIHALTFQRPNEVSGMEWSEIDLEAGLWTIPAARMKATLQRKAAAADHLVPLSLQAVSVLKDLQPLTGECGLVFPGERKGRAISENTARMALRSMGYADHTPHGFRASARTLIHENLGFHKEMIERQLSHGSDEALGGAYDRTQFYEQRKKMMQAWADYLDQLRNTCGAS